MTLDTKRKFSLPQFPLPSLEEQVVLVEQHGVDTLLFCPNAWALRHVFINQDTGEVVRARCNRWDCLYCDRDLVFCDVVGDYFPLSSLEYMFQVLLKKAGLPHMPFHNLRHSAATILLTMGIHPKAVQELLGHSQISMTMDTYSHVLPSMQQEAMNKLNEAFREQS